MNINATYTINLTSHNNPKSPKKKYQGYMKIRGKHTVNHINNPKPQTNTKNYII